MATFKPFAALRPAPALAGRVAELPYDVVSSAEARKLARDNPLSFFRVSKPEIGLDAGVDPTAPEVYESGRKCLVQLVQQGALARDSGPAFYLYRQVLGAHSQTGIVGTASCQEYLEGTIRRHELTRPDKEDDRVRHIETLQAQTGPAFLIYRSDPGLAEFLADRTAGAPEFEFAAADGIRHSGWVIRDPVGMGLIEARFQASPRLYIADGHHRSAAAARIHQTRGGRGGSDRFLAVAFPENQLQILPYHRLLKDLQGMDGATLLERLQAVFRLEPVPRFVPAGRHQLGLHLGGRWWRLSVRPELVGAGSVGDRLDVALLQRHVLGPILGIADPRTDPRIQFVGGLDGVGILERRVESGSAACAFALAPTAMEDLLAVADAGEIMPPKSTWFEPKLRDGLFSYLYDEFVLS